MSGFPVEEQRRLLDLQVLDSRGDALDQQWRTHPAVQALIDLSGQAAELEAQKASAQEAVDEVRRRVSSAERAADDIRAKQAKDQKRMDAGAVSSPRELESLQHEIATLQGRLDEIETTELEAMEEADAAESALAEVVASLAAIADESSRHEAELAEVRARIDTEREGLAADRAEVLADISEALLKHYERARSHHAGVGVGALRHGRCEGCRLTLNPSDLARFSSAPPDELLRCEECGRLLVRVDD
jgi:predicted  nucleic acid-binding Zn-ribbon protein